MQIRIWLILLCITLLNQSTYSGVGSSCCCFNDEKHNTQTPVTSLKSSRDSRRRGYSKGSLTRQRSDSTSDSETISQRDFKGRSESRSGSRSSSARLSRRESLEASISIYDILESCIVSDITKQDKDTSILKKISGIEEEYYSIQAKYEDKTYNFLFKESCDESIKSELAASRLAKHLLWIRPLPSVHKEFVFAGKCYNGILYASEEILHLDNDNTRYSTDNKEKSAIDYLKIQGYLFGISNLDESNLLHYADSNKGSRIYFYDTSIMQKLHRNNNCSHNLISIHYNDKFNTLDWLSHNSLSGVEFKQFTQESIDEFYHKYDISLPDHITDSVDFDNNIYYYKVFRNNLWVISEPELNFNLSESCKMLTEDDFRKLTIFNDKKKIRALIYISRGTQIATEENLNEILERIDNIKTYISF